MSMYRGRLKKALLDEDYRYAYDEEFANSRMATQIKVIREQREGMTQAQLAEKADMKQSRISALENVDYSAWSISTLRRLARALGVRLSFKFESWGELLPEVDGFSRHYLERPDFEHDPVFTAIEEKAVPKEMNKYVELKGNTSKDSERGNAAHVVLNEPGLFLGRPKGGQSWNSWQ